MKLQTQFTVPNKAMRDLDFVKKVETLEETFKRECQDYLTKEIFQFVLTLNQYTFLNIVLRYFS